MRATIEQLLDVVADLCAFGSMLFIGGEPARAQALIEQASELLVHRADVLARSTSGDGSGSRQPGVQSSTTPRMLRWTN